MFFILFTTFLITISVSIILFYKRSFNYWKNKNVIYETPELIFGNYKDVWQCKKDVWEMDLESYKKNSTEKFIGKYLGPQPVFLVKDPELIKYIMSKSFYYFNDKGLNVDKNDLLSINLFAISGDHWKLLRQHISPLFSSGKIKKMFYIITECCSQYEKYINKTVTADNIVDIYKLTSSLTLEGIGSCVFGLKFDVMHEENSRFRTIATRIFRDYKWKKFKTVLRSAWPSLFNSLKLKVTEDVVEDFFLNLVRNVFETRKVTKECRHDFIDLMMDLYEIGSIKGDGIESLINKEADQIELPVDFELITAQIFVFFVAGFETTASTMAYALYEMARNKDIQDKVYEEISQTLNKNSGNLNYDDIVGMTYLEMVISETLRMYPSLPNLTRKCTNTYHVPDSDLVIDANVAIHIPVYAIHYDPKYYPEPEKFKPERFTKEEKEKRPSCTYLPFGEGQRICIGMRFGKLQATAGIVTILKDYEVELIEDMNEPIKFKCLAMTLTPTKNMYLRFKRRAR